METFQLYIMDISLSGSTSGVDRYIEKLLEGLKHDSSVHVHWIQFLHDESLIVYREEQTEYYTKLTLPLPQNYKEIIAEKYWIRKYYNHVFHILQEVLLLKENCILHLQTLNLIDLALLIKEHVHCSIITHLHCIPWKGYYNLNMRRFNSLYETAHSGLYSIKDRPLFLTNHSELDSYILTDRIICVTQSEVEFLTHIMQIPKSKISVVHNGIDDYYDDFERRFDDRPSVPVQCLFVGNMVKSKGLEFVLQALRILKKRGFHVLLKIAGHVMQDIIRAVMYEYNDLELEFLGVLPFKQLTELYKSSDIGLIASLQEQWSFAAVEMAMFGLPIVTTAVDGLDEIFTDNVNAMKIDPSYSPVFGLTVGTELMANKIELLIEDVRLRKKLSRNVRLLYEKDLTLDLMVKNTMKVYEQISKIRL